MSALIQNTNRYEVLDPSQAASSSNDSSEPKIRYYILMGVFILTFFCGGAVYWAMSSKLDGAVVATASFEVEGNRKTVDHFDGGIVRAIHVADGDYVEAGQTLIELDSNDIDVDLNVLGSQFVDLSVRYARLTSQITGQPSFGLDDVIPTLPASVRKKDWRSSFITQQNLFQTEARARQAEVDIKEQKIKSLNTQIAGIENQRAANQRQLEITQNELSNLNALF